MFKKWGWYVVAVIGAMMAAFWSSGVHAAPGGTSMSVTIHSSTGPAHNSAPRMHEGPNSHPPHQHRPHHGHMHHPRPPVYFQPPPPVYYVPPAPRYYQTCQRWDGWRQQYIYVPC
jgi:hypothetical protein